MASRVTRSRVSYRSAAAPVSDSRTETPFLALWGLQYYPFWHLFAPGDTDVLGIPVTTLSFLDTVT